MKISRELKGILTFIFALGAFSCIIAVLFGEKDSNSQWICSLLPSYLLLYWIIFASNDKRKKYFKIQCLFEESVMDNSVFSELIGKNLAVKTLEQYLDGKLVKIVGDYLVLSKVNKKSEETIYVNVKTIETVRETVKFDIRK